MAVQSCNYIFKDQFMLSPSVSQQWMVISNIPHSLKLVYGLIADTVQIGNSRRKSLIYVGVAVQFLAL